jgi:quinol-cytochrome oxidoreductase complex cytochrome b subunit
VQTWRQPILEKTFMPPPNPTPDSPGFFLRFARSIFPCRFASGAERQDDRYCFNFLLLHLRPRTVPERTLQLSLTWGLGGASLVLILLSLGTGVLLKFAYLPFPGRAYESVLSIQNDIAFGRLVRNVHHWSANALLLTVFLHFLRVFFTGAFRRPRQFNWVIGLALFLTVVMSNFTGYFLPWDQLSFWAITISTGMLEYVPWIGPWLRKLIQGGPEFGPATLSNFYAIHTAVLPAALLAILPFHFWRIRRAGGLVIPRRPDEDERSAGAVSVASIPHLVMREAVAALVVIACLLVMSALFDAPLGEPANPGLSPNPTKAPWYFLGVQELLLHFHPLFSLFVIPILLTAGLVALPYLDDRPGPAGVWFVSFKARRMAALAAGAAGVGTSLAVLADERFGGGAFWLAGLPSVVSGGLIPFGFVLAGIVGLFGLLKWKYRPDRGESVQTIFVVVVTAFIVLTLIGIFFRGQGMRLVWPGSAPAPMS